jgi:hypothetical protein
MTIPNKVTAGMIIIYCTWREISQDLFSDQSRWSNMAELNVKYLEFILALRFQNPNTQVNTMSVIDRGPTCKMRRDAKNK